MSRHSHCTDYNGQTVYADDRSSKVRWVVKQLKLIGVDKFDTLAVSGYSGIGIASIVAHILKKNIVIIRKPDERKNSGNMIEAPENMSRIVIIDDLICSGETIKRIAKSIFDNYVMDGNGGVSASRPVECVAIVLYYQKDVYAVDGRKVELMNRILKTGSEELVVERSPQVFFN